VRLMTNDAKQRRVLVVDDEPLIRTILARALTDIGLVVDLAEDGRQGLARVREHVPRVVVLDLMMPNMDGLAFIDSCRSMPRCVHIPIILMSSEASLVTAQPRLAGKGVVVLMHKPFDLDTMLELVRRLSEPSG